MPLPLSVLDLAPINEGGTAREALLQSLDLIQHAEKWGYRRYWVAEHHNMMGVASAATPVTIGFLAAGTSTIRVGSGGVMLPNHAPLVVAEQFGTLASLYPDRIDLGLGRAPGTDQLTVLALRRDPASSDQFPSDVQELQHLLGPLQPGQRVRAVPGYGTRVPIYILGSSLFGARLAAALGLPYAFASHFAPDALQAAVQAYRENFRASEQLDAPYVLAALNVVAAETDAEATRLFTTMQQRFRDLGRPGDSQGRPPVEDIEAVWTPAEKARASHMLRYAAVGSPQTVKESVADFAAHADADELIVVTNTFDHADRLRSYELLADVHAHG
ncbi:LLM class flavin-dependent oxidoreductase [Microlunatus panaciterrae]|uniref:Luciferase family oxidoreductase group 1 n=1 Tax=Microlunatus panaciterrae TaxID=400768 RepID=A0ABS2RLZ1_9ACTN|nr:luciferase family oxidoreductase group 1 [Microlunatus panaciterrae]